MNKRHIAAKVLVLIAFASAGQIVAAGTVEIQINTSPAGVIRSDISRKTFGTGLQFDSTQVRWSMDMLPESSQGQPASTRLLGDTIGFLQLGTLRFPQGTSALHYFWASPERSWTEAGYTVFNDYNRYFTRQEILNYAAPGNLDMEPLFTVNTGASLNPIPPSTGSPFLYINENFFTTNPPLINQDNLALAADSAAQWVAAEPSVQYWEVGNEDWARWNAGDHAVIFETFRAAMKLQRPSIKLLAQGLAEPFGTNTPATWLSALTEKLSIDNKVDDVYAYSVHQYIEGASYAGTPLERRIKETQDMLVQTASGATIAALKDTMGIGTSTAAARNWKIWLTEFNAVRKDTYSPGGFAELNDMGHALVIADWTGKLLEQNVDRMFFHSLDNYQPFSLIYYGQQYLTFNQDVNHPRVSVPGFAYSFYAQQFGKTMVKNTITYAGQSAIAAPNGGSYDPVAVYSSISADESQLRVMVINRNLSDPVTVNLNILRTLPKRSLAAGSFTFMELKSTLLTDTNLLVGDNVVWSQPTFPTQSPADGTGDITLAPASANFFILPLVAPSAPESRR